MGSAGYMAPNKLGVLSDTIVGEDNDSPAIQG